MFTRLLILLLRWLAWYLHAVEIFVVRVSPTVFRIRVEPRRNQLHPDSNSPPTHADTVAATNGKAT